MSLGKRHLPLTAIAMAIEWQPSPLPLPPTPIAVVVNGGGLSSRRVGATDNDSL